MKTLFKFTVEKEEQVDDVVVTQNGAEEIKVTKKVSKMVPHTFAILRPNRTMFDAAELYYGVKLAEGIRAGLLTQALLEKRYINDGGILAQPEIKEIDKLRDKFFALKEKTEKILAKPEVDQTAEDKKTLDDSSKETDEIKSVLQEYEAARISLHDYTAESKARNKVIFWWVLNLALKEKGDTLEPLFPGSSMEDREKVYDAIDESEEKFMISVIQKLLYLISFWFVGKVASEDDFRNAYQAIK